MADLTEAKKELTQQLCDLLSPQIFKGIKSIWESEKKLKKFQEKLSLVPKWNTDIIDEEYNRICRKEETKDLLDKLIEATFLANVKVLSSVRVGKTRNINITIPESKKFMHHCYIETARKLWSDPHLIDDRKTFVSEQEVKRNNKRMILLIHDAIEKTISRLIPIQSILEKYLNDTSIAEVPEENEIIEGGSGGVDCSSQTSSEREIIDEEESLPRDPSEKDSSEELEDDPFETEPELSVVAGKDTSEANINPVNIKINPTTVDNTESKEEEKKNYFFDSDSDTESL